MFRFLFNTLSASLSFASGKKNIGANVLEVPPVKVSYFTTSLKVPPVDLPFFALSILT